MRAGRAPGTTGRCLSFPEVEAARRLIADRALHRLIADVDDSDRYVSRPHAAGELRSALTGRTLTAAHRRGKMIWLDTSPSGDPDGPPGPELGIHLGMSGRIQVQRHGRRGDRTAGDERRYDTGPRSARWNRFTLTFADGGRPGAAGPAAAGPGPARPRPRRPRPGRGPGRPGRIPPALITKGRIAVKARLLDQSKIAGVGNLLADEILWQAKVSPLALTDTFTPAQVNRLYRAVKPALAAAIANGGAHTGEIIAARHPGAPARATARRWCTAPLAAGPPGVLREQAPPRTVPPRAAPARAQKGRRAATATN